MPRRKPDQRCEYPIPGQDDGQREHLRFLRETALAAMSFLEEFRPRLTGAVLDGTAGPDAEIEIDLFVDSAKEAEISLLSRNIPYEPADNGRQNAKGREARLRLDWNGVPVLLSLYPIHAERHLRRGQARAKADALSALLSEEYPPSGQIAPI